MFEVINRITAETYSSEAQIRAMPDVVETLGNVIFLCFSSFAESPLGQDTTIQDEELECLPAQQAQRPVQRSP